METNFQKVVQFNEKAGYFLPDEVDQNIFDNDPKTVKLKLDLILEEVDELKEAVKTKNIVETVDALSDILYVVYGMGAALGINMDDSFDIVHKSNMSKFCQTEQQAIDTVLQYKKLYEEGTSPYDSPDFKLSDDKKYYIIYNKSTGKTLKSKYYQEVDFYNIIN